MTESGARTQENGVHGGHFVYCVSMCVPGPDLLSNVFLLRVN